MQVEAPERGGEVQGLRSLVRWESGGEEVKVVAGVLKVEAGTLEEVVLRLEAEQGLRGGDGEGGGAGEGGGHLEVGGLAPG